jgi:CsoR family transcriptional regulator, copper-sensing transcriptional repressor
MPAEVNTPQTEHSEQKAKIINRLKRLEGQVRGLQAMVEEERDCHDILTLLSGIRSALNATGDIILATYLEKCQTDLKKGKGNIDELVEAVRLARG